MQRGGVDHIRLLKSLLKGPYFLGPKDRGRMNAAEFERQLGPKDRISAMCSRASRPDRI